MHSSGTAYVVQWEEETVPDFLENIAIQELSENNKFAPSEWTTLFISGGRKDKISKGDLAGLFMKQGGLKSEDVGVIEIKQDCAFIAVKKNKARSAIKALDNSRVKKKKVRINEI